MTNPAIEKLNEYIFELERVTDFSSIQEKAEHIGQINLIKDAVKQLQLCEEFEVSGGSLFSKLPETASIHHCYKVVYENESSNPSNWEEVLFNGQQLTFSAGDLIVRK
ncbi:MAG: hypothetical protein Alis3KO_41340 [Aliiglaciecola sp.]